MIRKKINLNNKTLFLFRFPSVLLIDTMRKGLVIFVEMGLLKGTVRPIKLGKRKSTFQQSYFLCIWSCYKVVNVTSSLNFNFFTATVKLVYFFISVVFLFSVLWVLQQDFYDSHFVNLILNFSIFKKKTPINLKT